MKLEGSIHRFNLASVLQFLAQNDATGVLEVRNGRERGFVYLVNGYVEGISLPTSDELLGTRLVKAGCLTEEQLRQALMEDASLSSNEKRMKPLGQRLVEKGFTSEASVREVMRRQVLDEVFEIAQWRTGVFKYDEPDDMPIFRVAIQGDVWALLTSVERRTGPRARGLKTVAVATNEVCIGCPLEGDCSAAIKEKYLKHDVCLWRKMTVGAEEDGPGGFENGPQFDARIGEATPSREAKPVLDASLGWD